MAAAAATIDLCEAVIFSGWGRGDDDDGDYVYSRRSRLDS